MFVVYTSHLICSNKPIAIFSEDGPELQAFLEMTGMDQEDREEVVIELKCDELNNYLNLGMKLYMIESDGEDYYRVEESGEILQEMVDHKFKPVDDYEVINVFDDKLFLWGTIWTIDKQAAEEKLRRIVERVKKNNWWRDGYFYQSTYPFK